MPARFVLRDNVLMYFNSPKDFTGFRDKPSVRPRVEQLGQVVVTLEGVAVDLLGLGIGLGCR